MHRRAFATELTRELCAISWTVAGNGRILIESKADVRVKLGGQSPDVADALAVAVTTDGVPSFDVPSRPVAF